MWGIFLLIYFYTSCFIFKLIIEIYIYFLFREMPYGPLSCFGCVGNSTK